MKPIELRVTLLTTALILICMGISYLGYRDFQEVKRSQEELISIIDLKNITEVLHNKKQTDSFIKELQVLRSQIQNNPRQVLFSDVIQSFSSGNIPLMNRRIRAFNAFEKKYYASVLKQLDFLEKQILFHSAIFLCSFLFTVLFMRRYLSISVFTPLRKIQNRMIDFLNGKYSYYFGTPPENELGELQATFNSMAQEVLENMEELKALDSAKSDFLNIASHELRTPMTSIKGSLSLVTSGVMGEVTPDIHNLLDIAESETDRLIRLINDILDIAKIDAKKLPLKKEWINLKELISKTTLSLQGFSQSLSVPIHIQEFPDIQILADADRIQQVLTNLVSNAIKFSPPNKSILIFVESTLGSPLKILVQDQGKGMTPQEKTILFQKFRQITSPDNPLVKGTGLGLAIAKALVEEHEGTIDVQTIPNEGSTFYFTLPHWKQISESDEIPIAA